MTEAVSSDPRLAVPSPLLRRALPEPSAVADFPTSLPSFCRLPLLSSHLLPPAHGPCAAPLCGRGAPSPAVPARRGLCGDHPALSARMRRGRGKKRPPRQGAEVTSALPLGTWLGLCRGLLEGLGTALRMLHRAEQGHTPVPGSQCSGQTDGCLGTASQNLFVLQL